MSRVESVDIPLGGYNTQILKHVLPCSGSFPLDAKKFSGVQLADETVSKITCPAHKAGDPPPDDILANPRWRNCLSITRNPVRTWHECMHSTKISMGGHLCRVCANFVVVQPKITASPTSGT